VEKVLGVADGQVGKRVPKVIRRIEGADEADIEAFLGEEGAKLAKRRGSKRPSSGLTNGEVGVVEKPPAYEQVTHSPST
jgi:hypothetical protein